MAMSDIATIGAVVSSVKTAVEIAKTIKDLDAKVQQAELKLKVADLLGALADAKIAATELQDLVAKKDEEIGELRKSIAIKGDVVRRGDAYYMKGSGGAAAGEPYCTRCWEVEAKLFHLVRHPSRPDQVCPCVRRCMISEWYRRLGDKATQGEEMPPAPDALRQAPLQSLDKLLYLAWIIVLDLVGDLW